jgi:formate dehydrogenase subunit gamma
MTNAYRAMRTGYVTAAWAKHHHQRWYEDVVAGRAREKLLRPGSAPVEGRQAPPARTKPV